MLTRLSCGKENRDDLCGVLGFLIKIESFPAYLLFQRDTMRYHRTEDKWPDNGQIAIQSKGFQNTERGLKQNYLILPSL